MMQTYTGAPVTGARPPRTTGEFLAALLQATLNAKKIQCLVAHQWDGPQVQVFSCSLGLGEDPKRMERLVGSLAQAAGAAEARVSRGQGCLWIEIPKPENDRLLITAAQQRILALIGHTAEQIAKENGDPHLTYALDTLRAQIQGLPGMSTPGTAALPDAAAWAGDARSHRIKLVPPQRRAFPFSAKAAVE